MMRNCGRVLVLVLVLVTFSFPVLAEIPPITEADFVFTFTDVNFALGGEAGALISKIEETLGWDDVSVMEGCLYPGEDKEYANAFITVATIPGGKNGEDTIESIMVSGGEYITSRGIAIGATTAQIEEAYGKDYVFDWDQLIFSPGDITVSPMLIFQIDEEGCVTSWLMYRNTQI